MTKDELFETLDYQNGDMVFIMRVRDTDKGFSQQRIIHGMHPYMLIGIADVLRDEVLSQISGEKKPRIIDTERIVVE